jgi:hypothetical protein
MLSRACRLEPVATCVHKTSSPSSACAQDQCDAAPAIHVVHALCATCCVSSLTDDCRGRSAAAAVLWAVHVCIAVLLQSRWSFTTFRGYCTCNKRFKACTRLIQAPSKSTLCDPSPIQSRSKLLSGFGWTDPGCPTGVLLGRTLDGHWIPLSHSVCAPGSKWPAVLQHRLHAS